MPVDPLPPPGSPYSHPPGFGGAAPLPPLIAQPVNDEGRPIAVAARTIAAPAGVPQPIAATRQDKRRAAAKPDVFRGRRKFVAAFTSSAVLHCLLVIVAGLLSTAERRSGAAVVLTASVDVGPAPTLEHVRVPRPVVPELPKSPLITESPREAAAKLVEQRPAGNRGLSPKPSPLPSTFAPGAGGQGDWLTEVGGSAFGMLDGRSGDAKQGLLADATTESEQAVYKGLKWLAAHQRDDGSWHFNHTMGGCTYCPNPGMHGSTTAATGLALLPFLGAGHTHKKGEFQDTVKRGLDFLAARMKRTPLGGDLQDGVNLYSQAIATLALGEALAMTDDRSLYEPTSEAIRFIVNAQDKKGGGWRYFPGQVGDTTVTGWMLMALKSGQLSYLPIPPDVWTGARRFLDSVQDDKGAAYGYQAPSREEPTMTAIGLLCRMYGGWPRSTEALGRGIHALAKRGPSDHDLYFDYYATQALRHYGGHDWQGWNVRMRDYLVKTQETRGHMSGSWYFADKHGDQGGRLYNTAMAVLILEVYYRYLPIYGRRAVGDDFRDFDRLNGGDQRATLQPARGASSSPKNGR